MVLLCECKEPQMLPLAHFVMHDFDKVSLEITLFNLKRAFLPDLVKLIQMTASEKNFLKGNTLLNQHFEKNLSNCNDRKFLDRYVGAYRSRLIRVYIGGHSASTFWTHYMSHNMTKPTK